MSTSCYSSHYLLLANTTGISGQLETTVQGNYLTVGLDLDGSIYLYILVELKSFVHKLLSRLHAIDAKLGSVTGSCMELVIRKVVDSMSV